jgi:hypothetical protein
MEIIIKNNIPTFPGSGLTKASCCDLIYKVFVHCTKYVILITLAKKESKK